MQNSFPLAYAGDSGQSRARISTASATMWTTLHPAIKGALGVFLLELLIANPTQQLYQWLLKWEPSMPDYIPGGLLSGIGIGLIALLYYMRHDEPGWWRVFDVNKRTYENQVLSMRAISRACMTKDKLLPITKASFVGCRFVGPDVAVVVGGNSPMFEDSQFVDIGTPILMADGDQIVGSVVFDQCLFRSCIFDKVQMIVPKHLHEGLARLVAQKGQTTT